LFFLGWERILYFKNMYWTVTSRIAKNRLLFSFRRNSFNGIVKLHNVTTVTDDQNLLFRKRVLFLQNIFIDHHLYEFMDSLIDINPTLSIFAFILSYWLLLFLSLFFPSWQRLSSQYSSMFLSNQALKFNICLL